MKIKSDFNNPSGLQPFATQNFRRLERLAYDGTLDCSDFPPPEYKYFSELRKVYQAFKFEGMSQEDAQRLKKSLLMDYSSYLETFDNARRTYADWQNNIRTSEMLMTHIQKSHDVHDIAVTAVKIIGLMTHDETFVKTNTQKLEALK